MKQANLFIKALLCAAVLFLSFPASAQTTSDPTLPDYTRWEKTSTALSHVIFDGKDTDLKSESYRNLYRNSVTIKYSEIVLIYNSDGNPWIAIYQEVVGEIQPDVSIAVVAIQNYAFENFKGKWVYVKDLAEIKGQAEFDNFLKDEFVLEFKK